MSDERGVAVWRWYSAYADAQEDTEYTDIKPVDLAGGEEPGRWFPEAQSLARDRVIEAATVVEREGNHRAAMDELADAISSLKEVS